MEFTRRAFSPPWGLHPIGVLSNRIERRIIKEPVHEHMADLTPRLLKVHEALSNSFRMTCSRAVAE